MKINPEPVSFDWDSGNSSKNADKHQVSCQEAEEVFFNKPLIVVEDELHSAIEKRYWALGKTSEGRRLFLVFTQRASKIRVISVRDMNRKERDKYEQKNK